MKNQDFSVFQKLIQIVSRGFPRTPPVSCGPEMMFSMGVSFHNVVRSPDMCRTLHSKIWKMMKNDEILWNIKIFRFFKNCSQLFLEGSYALPRSPAVRENIQQLTSYVWKWQAATQKLTLTPHSTPSNSSCDSWRLSKVETHWISFTKFKFCFEQIRIYCVDRKSVEFRYFASLFSKMPKTRVWCQSNISVLRAQIFENKGGGGE